VFVRVVDSGSFSAVAREAGIGQLAVSKQIAALEARLHVVCCSPDRRRRRTLALALHARLAGDLPFAGGIERSLANLDLTLSLVMADDQAIWSSKSRSISSPPT
jgi:hypothetical protein